MFAVFHQNAPVYGATHAPEIHKWPVADRVAIIVGGSAALWVAIIVALAR